MDTNEKPENPRRYRWPYYLLAAVLLGIALSVYAVIKEARRIQTFERTDPLFQRPVDAGGATNQTRD